MSLWQRFITWLLSLPFQRADRQELAYWRKFDAEWRAEMEKHWQEYLEASEHAQATTESHADIKK
jgi:hypothetical protein